MARSPPAASSLSPSRTSWSGLPPRSSSLRRKWSVTRARTVTKSAASGPQSPCDLIGPPATSPSSGHPTGGRRLLRAARGAPRRGSWPVLLPAPRAAPRRAAAPGQLQFAGRRAVTPNRRQGPLEAGTEVERVDRHELQGPTSCPFGRLNPAEPGLPGGLPAREEREPIVGDPSEGVEDLRLIE